MVLSSWQIPFFVPIGGDSAFPRLGLTIREHYNLPDNRRIDKRRAAVVMQTQQAIVRSHHTGGFFVAKKAGWYYHRRG